MAIFDIVDLTQATLTEDPHNPSPDAGGAVGGQGIDGVLGAVDTTVVAVQLESLRADLSAHISESSGSGLALKSLVLTLSIGAEGKVAFVAKGTAEASIEITFESRSAG